MSDEKKELNIKSDQLRIANLPGVEPEAQPVAHQYKTDVNAGPRGGKVVGAIPGMLQYETTAGQMANAVKTACAGCAHFDVRLWQQYLKAAEGPLAKPEMKATMQAMRERIKKAGYGYEVLVKGVAVHDIEATMQAHGVCRVLSDWVEGALKAKDPMWWPVVPWREATCPTYVQAGPHRMDVVTPAQPFGLYKPKDLDAKNIGAKRYDGVLFNAAGKGKR